MSEFLKLIDSIEDKLSKVLLDLEKKKKENKNLLDLLDKKQEHINKLNEELKVNEEKYNSLMLTNSLLGSEDYKRETKLKINNLVKEIDHCIAQLSK